VSEIALKRKLKLDGEVPRIEITVPDDDGETMRIDICSSSDGCEKSAFIRKLYSADVTSLPLFYCLKLWAQCCGLLKGAISGRRRPILSTGQFQALILCFYEETMGNRSNIIAIDRENSREEDNRIIANSLSCSPLLLGKRLLSFFQWGASLFKTHIEKDKEKEKKRSFTYTWPIARPHNCPPLSHTLLANELNTFSTLCFRACHVIGVSHSWPLLLDRAIAHHDAYTDFAHVLSRTVSEKMRSCVEYHSLRLSAITKAEVIVCYESSKNSSSQCLTVRGTGTFRQIMRLKEELNKIIFMGRMYAYGYLGGSRADAYFLEGSSYVFARNAGF
jgi:hypothetical protein